MDNDKRPHSRNKTVAGGSANVQKGRKVNSGPVGSGGRGQGGSQERSGSGGQRSMPKLNFKTILVLAVVLIAAFFLFRKCGILPTGTVSDDSNYSQNNTSSYSKVDTTCSNLAREKYYTPQTGDDVTIMVYMCGTDLESKYGMATNDLNEMMRADIADNLNLIVETGGCSKWKTNGISSTCNQIYKVESGKMRTLESDFGTASMTDPGNLTRFIRYCTQEYPAERNILILWDHGGGSVSGFGYDEKNKKSSSMTLSKINTALSDADCKFDFIGFDACLMATLETDLICSNYADYLIASEETEPGTGWYYTNWLTMLCDDTAKPTVYIAEKLIDDFVAASCSARSNAQVTLSVVDLAELDGTVPNTLRDFAASTNALVRSDDYSRVSNARAGTRQFSAKSKINQIDLIDLAERIGTEESAALAEALHGCVKYNKTTISRANGISIYFPYETTKTVESAIASYNEIGKDKDYSECIGEYSKCIRSFASLEYGGQIAASASQTQSSGDWGSLLGSLISGNQSESTSPVSVLSGMFSNGASGFSMDSASISSLLGAFSGREMPEGCKWVDTELIADKAEQLAQQFVDPAAICASQKNGRKVLALSDEEWSLIQTVELSVYAFDGDGYIDLGLDNTFDWLDSNALLLEYDGTWLTLNEHVCAYYLESDTEQPDGSYVTVGRIPALLNGEYVYLRVVFDSEHLQGCVTGAYPMYEDLDVQAKGNIEIVAGDTLELLCDYYDLDGNFSAAYTLGEQFTVPSDGLTLTNLAINTDNVSVMYRLTDIYGNHFWICAD